MFSGSDLRAIKNFALENFDKAGQGEDAILVDITMPDGDEVSCSSVWFDRTGRFPLNDYDAVKEWGLVGVISYIKTVESCLAVAKVSS